MGLFRKKDNELRPVESMTTQERADMIKRLERERRKINSEIEGILKSYSKESGNRALRRKKLSKTSDGLLDLFND